VLPGTEGGGGASSSSGQTGGGRCGTTRTLASGVVVGDQDQAVPRHGQKKKRRGRGGRKVRMLRERELWPRMAPAVRRFWRVRAHCRLWRLDRSTAPWLWLCLTTKQKRLRMMRREWARWCGWDPS
jgi:hypothetical protein